MGLREANQGFSRLVREVEHNCEPVLVLRNGKPAALITAGYRADPEDRKAALARILDPENRVSFPKGWRFNREEIYDEAIERHASVRNGAKALKKRRHG
jgi:antitoxin (DNA-binding transcriptional repressor) of toxin-antitoxin stability system